MDWKQKYSDKVISAEEAARLIESGDRVTFPVTDRGSDVGLALCRRAHELKGVTVTNIWHNDYPWFKPGMEESFIVRELFTTQITRKAVKERRTDWVSMLPGLSSLDFEGDPMRGRPVSHADVCLVRVTPPDENGYCSFGHLTWTQPVAAAEAKMVIAEVDPTLPWVYGDNIHVSKLDYLVEWKAWPKQGSGARTLPAPGDYEKAQVIASLATDLMKDGDTIELGVGTIGELIPSFLGTRNDLGMDSEVILEGVINLVQQGVITGKRKNVNKGKVVTTAAALYVSQDALNFLHQNPVFEFRDFSYIANLVRIASNDNMVACNSILGVDLLGQVNLDWLNGVPISGTGGNVEYTIGSHYSKGGRSISCLLSTAKENTVSRIVPQFERGNYIEIPMTYLDYLITEYGVVNLSQKSRRQRAEAIISVAHPDFQPELRKAARQLFWP
jgi:4-hydroxybutyrate CoA-transferase